MKLKLLLGCLAFFALKLTAQNVSIPDANFKAFLVTNYDTNGDNQISTAEALGVSGTMNASNLAIADLTGIEAFVNVTILNVEGNTTLTTLDLSQNTAITTLDVDNTAMTYLKVNALTNLQFLYASNMSNLRYLDLGDNGALFSITAQNNPNMTAVNLDNGNPANLFIVDLTSNTALTCIQVDAVTLMTPPATWLKDATANYSISCPEFCRINIPDPVFKTRLLTSYDSNGDGELQCDEAIAVSGVLNVAGLNIYDLTGVEALVNLTHLYFFNTPVTGTLDLSANTQLVSIRGFNANLNGLITGNNTNLTNVEVYNNSISVMDFTQNPSIETLHVYGNNLSSLDITQNVNLENLNITNSNFTTIDISNNVNLRYFSSVNTPLTGSIDFSHIPNLSYMLIVNSQLSEIKVTNGNNTAITTVNLLGNSNLLCVEVDDPVYSYANWTQKEAHTGYSDDCVAFLCTITIPDANFKYELLNNTAINLNNDGEIQCHEAQQFTGTLNVGGKNIADMTGIEAFENLTQLICFANQITSLDLSNNTSLTTLFCNSNQLTSLNLANGNNASIVVFNSTNNPGLNCVTVDDANYSTANWTNRDVHTSFSANCSSTLSLDQVNLLENVKLYPNPATHVLNIATEVEIKEIRLYDVLGQEILKTNRRTIDLRALNSGMYLVKLIGANNASVTKRFMKQ